MAATKAGDGDDEEQPTSGGDGAGGFRKGLEPSAVAGPEKIAGAARATTAERTV